MNADTGAHHGRWRRLHGADARPTVRGAPPGGTAAGSTALLAGAARQAPPPAGIAALALGAPVPARPGASPAGAGEAGIVTAFVVRSRAGRLPPGV